MKKKSLIMLVCALMIVSSMAFGTIAYLTDRAGVTNKFTIGNVDITVDETDVDANGDPIYPEDADPDDPNEEPLRTEEGNEYHLIPGSDYTKDPTLTIKAGSESAYVRMVVTITGINEINKVYEELKAMYPGNEAFANGFVPADCVSGWNSTLWPFAGYSVDAVANTLSLEFRYQHVVNGSNGDSALPPLFTSFTVPGEITADQLATLADVTIDVVGHAIQQTGFADADAAWAAFDAQNAAVSD